LEYVESVDIAPPQSAQLGVNAALSDGAAASVAPIDELWQQADGASVDLEKQELARALMAVGVKYNYGQPASATPSQPQMEAFWRSLQLRELALAQACALGRDAAWQKFLREYREPLTQAAIGITGSAALGEELADSLYSEMFGLTERDGVRRSPLASYSGRGSLKGFLRATLAQRNVDRHRKTHRETPLEDQQLVAPAETRPPHMELLERLGTALATALGALDAEERFILAAWFLDGQTLLAIAAVLRVHEATISRRIKRLTDSIRKDLLRNLVSSGMSKAAAEEALGTDPRYVDINLRRLLQASRPSAFLKVAGSGEPGV
jgi:RNA polymerase sigma-70 factor (ECF subfamily)